MKAVIPAAGLGTRLLPLTKAQPKEMLPVVDKPAIQYVVEEAAHSGINDILIITGRGKRAIEDHFDHSYELESILKSKGAVKILKSMEAITGLADIYYIRQKESRGLGDAVLCSKAYIGDNSFAVLLGDTIVCGQNPCIKTLQEIYEKKRVSVIAVERVTPEKVSRYGIIAAKPLSSGLLKVTDLVEKPSAAEAPSDLAIFGRYVLTPSIYECLERTPPGVGGEIQLTDALKLLLDKEEILAYEIKERRFDIGNETDWLQANVELALAHPEIGALFRPFLKQLLGFQALQHKRFTYPSLGKV